VVWLFFSSLISAFSIPINKKLFGNSDPLLISALFCCSSALFFLPFFRRQLLSALDFCKILLIGAIQFGLMYSLFQASFFFLNGHEVALLLVPTPVYVAAIGSFFSKNWDGAPTVVAVIIGLSVVFLMDFSQKFYFKWQGILLTQGCNFSFALGQILIKRFCEKRGISGIFSISAALYAGATAICLLSRSFFYSAPVPAKTIIEAALFGVICCGICHWLWNTGALRTKIYALAAMNNLQIPLSIIISCTIFGEKINFPRFIGSVAIVVIICLPLACGRCFNRCHSGDSR
jgi:drug/metabolite transporter (DMT)-like permease